MRGIRGKHDTLVRLRTNSFGGSILPELLCYGQQQVSHILSLETWTHMTTIDMVTFHTAT